MADKATPLQTTSSVVAGEAPAPVEAVDTLIPAAQGERLSLFQQALAIPWIGALLALILLGLFLSVELGPAVFLSSDNFDTVVRSFSFIGIAALGSTIVIIGGGIDLSVGSTMALTGVLTAITLTAGWPVPLAILVGLGVGAAVGAVNSFLITVIRLLPFIATLGMLSAARGLGTGIVSGQTLNASDTFDVIGQGSWGPIPISLVLLCALTALCAYFMTNTTWGRHIYAVGGNEGAARLLGINVAQVKWLMYILAGVLGAIGGIVLTARLGSGGPGNATGYELRCIAAAVVGGASLTGGEGSIFGSLVGAVLLALIQDGLDLNGWGDYWQDLVIGVTILLAVAVDQLRRRLRRA